MIKTIWKFPFETADVVEIEMPGVPEILSVQVQNGQPCIWAIVDPNALKRVYRFRVYGTGHVLPTYGPTQTPYGRYVGTYQMMDGALVWHLFQFTGAL